TTDVFDVELLSENLRQLVCDEAREHVGRTGGRNRHDYANGVGRIRLRARRERPRHRAAEQRDEFAPPHSITSSAVICIINGTVRPSDLAVLRLMNSSNFVACWTGKSAGFSPLRIRPV